MTYRNHKGVRMDATVYGLALSRIGIVANSRQNSSYEGARLVLVEGRRMSEVTRLVRCSRQAIYAAMKKIDEQFKLLEICKTCGQRLPAV